MISEAAKRRLEALYAAQGSYQPDKAIQARLADKTMIMLIGASCEGKNTVMEATAALDERFAITGNITTRPPRSDDDPNRYVYYEHTDPGLQELLRRIERHEVVNYAINRHTQYIYAGDLDDYPAQYNLGDVVSNAVDGYRKLGFKKTIAITIISEPGAWLERFEARFPRAHPQRSARRAEAIESFTWSLSQSESGHYWIENKDGAVEAAGRELIAIALGRSRGNPAAKDLARNSLELARNLDI